jgi:uncharacterized protein (TIGR02145 family)
MKHFPIITILTYPIILALFGISCVFQQFSGNSSEVDNKTLCGIIFEPDGKTRAKDASVYIRSRDFLSPLPALHKRSAGKQNFVDSTRTNDTGYYQFDSIPYGLYCLEARDGKSNRVFRDSIAIDSIAINAHKKHQPLSDTLEPTGGIKGIVPLIGDSAQAIVRVFGLNTFATADSNGNFIIENLPVGNMRLQVFTIQGNDKFYDTLNIVVKPGEAGMNKFKVSFDTRGGNEIASQFVDSGNYAVFPLPPTGKACSFAGWYKEPACTTEWQFVKEKVKSPLTLYAKWIVVDVDGNVYSTVKIGNQVWLAENLKTTKYNDSTEIPIVEDSAVWENLITPAYCWNNNDSAMHKKFFGALYNWYAVNTGKLAPAGWHVSTMADWDTLQNTLLAKGYSWDGTSDITIAKALAAESYWSNSTNPGDIGNDLSKNNSSGFSALPGGYRFCGSNFEKFGYWGAWWTATELNKVEAFIIQMSYDNSIVFSTQNMIGYCSQNMKVFGCSVRCVRDK